MCFDRINFFVSLSLSLLTRFSRLVTNVFISEGIKVYLFSRETPTPFTVRERERERERGREEEEGVFCDMRKESENGK